MAASNRSIMVGGKKKMITIDVHGDNEEEEDEQRSGRRSGNVSRVKTIELRGPRAREMFRKERVEYVVAPRHHRAMHTLYMHNPSFGPSVRLCRRWLHSMMLSDAYEHEVSYFFFICFFVVVVSHDFFFDFSLSFSLFSLSLCLQQTTTTNLCTGR